MDNQSEISKAEKQIKIHTTIYYYTKDKPYKETIPPDKASYYEILDMLEDKLYLEDPFNLTVLDVIYFCSHKLFNKWKRDNDCLVNIKVDKLFGLSTRQFEFIKNNRQAILRGLHNG